MSGALLTSDSREAEEQTGQVGSKAVQQQWPIEAGCHKLWVKQRENGLRKCGQYALLLLSDSAQQGEQQLQ